MPQIPDCILCQIKKFTLGPTDFSAAASLPSICSSLLQLHARRLDLRKTLLVMKSWQRRYYGWFLAFLRAIGKSKKLLAYRKTSLPWNVAREKMLWIQLLILYFDT